MNIDIKELLIFDTAVNQIAKQYNLYIIMSVERKNPLKRDQPLNDATSGQIGEEPRSVPNQ
jgi:hypothetical protein